MLLFSQFLDANRYRYTGVTIWYTEYKYNIYRYVIQQMYSCHKQYPCELRARTQLTHTWPTSRTKKPRACWLINYCQRQKAFHSIKNKTTCLSHLSNHKIIVRDTRSNHLNPLVHTIHQTRQMLVASWR